MSGYHLLRRCKSRSRAPPSDRGGLLLVDCRCRTGTEDQVKVGRETQRKIGLLVTTTTANGTKRAGYCVVTKSRCCVVISFGEHGCAC
ncbi:hypothetical protein RP20_CCG011056 [Aedes albopictus]|nr:hypothetical protein RP20_CCG011056 [Aedes albopictus]